MFMNHFNIILVLVAFITGAVVEFIAFREGFLLGERERLKKAEERKEQEKRESAEKELFIDVVDIKRHGNSEDE